MAKAAVDTVTKKVMKEVEEETIQLTLSMLEARVLYALTLFVYGSTDTYNREIASIRAAIYSAGKFGYVPVYRYLKTGDGSDIEAQRHQDQDK